MTHERSLLFYECGTKIPKTSSSYRMMSWGFYRFETNAQKPFPICGHSFQNERGFQRDGFSLWLRVSNRGEKRPVGRGVQRGQRPRGGGFQRRQSCLGRRHPMEGSALRGRKNPMKPAVSWHTTLPAKSSVLYLLRPLALERGCFLTKHTVSRDSRTGGFWRATG